MTQAFAYLQSNESTANAASYTFSSENIGAAASGRVVIVGFAARAQFATSLTVSSATIGGVTASFIEVQSAGTNSDICGFIYAAVPTGTTGDVVINLSRTVLRCGIETYRAEDITFAPHDSGTSTATDPTFNLDIPVGFAIGMSAHAGNGSTTWTGLTEDDDNVVESGLTFSCASDEFVSTETGRTITANSTLTIDPAGAFASWAWSGGGVSVFSGRVFVNHAAGKLLGA